MQRDRLGQPDRGAAADRDDDVDSGPVGVENSTVRGSVTLRRNHTATVVSANRITGSLTCSGNDPAPDDNGLPNRVTGQVQGQCAKL